MGQPPDMEDGCEHTEYAAVDKQQWMVLRLGANYTHPKPSACYRT